MGHIQYLADACNKRLNVVKSIQNQNWGADRASIIMIYEAFIRAKLDYGCHLYDSASKSVKNKLNIIQNTALRLAQGALKNTKIKILKTEANVPPLQFHRDYHSINYGAKIISDIRHPTRPYLINHNEYQYSNNKPYGRRLFEIGQKYTIDLSKVDNRCDFSIPPWIKPQFKLDLSIHNGEKDNTPIEVLQAKSLETINKYKNTEHYYTDGSVQGKKTGIGVFHKNFSECIRIPDDTTIYTAEAYAILRALRQGLKSKKDMTIFTDSLSCLVAIKHYQTEHTIITRILNILHFSSLNISLCWIPSHCNVLGNEQADRIAKRSLNLADITNINIPRAELMKQAKKNIIKEWQREFDLINTYKVREKIEAWETTHHKNRNREVILARLRMNSVKGIHLIPHIEGTYPRTFQCDGSILDLTHVFFNCGHYVEQRWPLLEELYNNNLNYNLKDLLSDNETLCDLTLEFLKETDFLKEI